MRPLFAALLASFTIGSIAPAQSAPPRLYLAPVLSVRAQSYALLTGGQARLAGAPAGRVVLVPRYAQGNIVAMDSMGTLSAWKVPVGGRADSSEIGWIDRVGWAGRTLWVSDPRYAQIVLVNERGEVTKSVPHVSWVHPGWSDRRKYPVYADMHPLAYYADGGMLVVPGRPRALLDTPGFDRTLNHVMRIDADGVILRDVTQMEKNDGMLELRGEGNNTRTIPIPFYGRTSLLVSPDGERIITVRPSLSASDNGSYRVTAFSPRGDTVYSRRIPMAPVRIAQTSIDSATRNPGAYGTLTVDQVRAMVRKKIPVYRSLITDAYVGFDHSVWIVTRSPIDSVKTREAMIIGPDGAVIGVVEMPANLKEISVGADRLWGIERGTNTLVRLRLQSTPPPPPAKTATPAPPARSVKAGAA